MLIDTGTKLLILLLLRYEVAPVQSCSGTKLLRYKVATVQRCYGIMLGQNINCRFANFFLCINLDEIFVYQEPKPQYR
jgi:hypothetical protein